MSTLAFAVTHVEFRRVEALVMAIERHGAASIVCRLEARERERERERGKYKKQGFAVIVDLGCSSIPVHYESAAAVVFSSSDYVVYLFSRSSCL